MKGNNLVDFSCFASHVSFKKVEKTARKGLFRNHREVGWEIFSEEFFEI